MNRKFRKTKLVSEINITPFTDVILVLLVIFMISTPLIYQTGFRVKLPQAQGGMTDKLGEVNIYVTITNENVLYLDKEVVTRKEFKDKINLLYRKNPSAKVVLQADRMVRFQDIVEVLDVLTVAGLTKLNIAAIKKP